MKITHRRSVQLLLIKLALVAVGTGVATIDPAIAQQASPSPVVLPDAIPGDTRPVLVIAGIESTVQDSQPSSASSPSVVEQADKPGQPDDRRRPVMASDRFGGPRAEPPAADRQVPPRRRPDAGGQRPITPMRPALPAPQGLPDPQEHPGPQGFQEQHGVPRLPAMSPPFHMALAPAGMQPDFDQLFQSPAIKKVMELMQENMELKAQMKIHGIQTESKMRVQEMEFKVEQLRRELNESNAALKEATVAKERLEKRISELEHRSRLLEERAKAISDQSSQRTDAEFFRRFATDMRRQFDERTGRSERGSRGEKEDNDEGDRAHLKEKNRNEDTSREKNDSQ